MFYNVNNVFKHHMLFRFYPAIWVLPNNYGAKIIIISEIPTIRYKNFQEFD